MQAQCIIAIRHNACTILTNGWQKIRNITQGALQPLIARDGIFVVLGMQNIGEQGFDGFLDLALILLAVLTASLPAHAQSLGMLVQAGLVPGLEGRVLRLATGPITGGEATDLAALPLVDGAPGGFLLGS